MARARRSLMEALLPVSMKQQQQRHDAVQFVASEGGNGGEGSSGGDGSGSSGGAIEAAAAAASAAAAPPPPPLVEAPPGTAWWFAYGTSMHFASLSRIGVKPLSRDGAFVVDESVRMVYKHRGGERFDRAVWGAECVKNGAEASRPDLLRPPRAPSLPLGARAEDTRPQPFKRPRRPTTTTGYATLESMPGLPAAGGGANGSSANGSSSAAASSSANGSSGGSSGNGAAPAPPPRRPRFPPFAGRVHGVCYLVAAPDLARAAKSEAGYALRKLEVQTYDGRRVEAAAFVSAPLASLREEVAPPEIYMRALREGARDQYLDPLHQGESPWVGLGWVGWMDDDERVDDWGKGWKGDDVCLCIVHVGAPPPNNDTHRHHNNASHRTTHNTTQ